MEERAAAVRAAARGGVAARLGIFLIAAADRKCGCALRRWTAAVGKYKAAATAEETRRARIAERDAGEQRRAAKEATAALKDERAAHRQIVDQLKRERRAASTAREAEKAAAQRSASLATTVEAARKKEEAMARQISNLKKELSDMRSAAAALRQ